VSGTMSDDMEDCAPRNDLIFDGPLTRARYSKAEWNAVKPFIQSYYVDENHSLGQLQDKLATVFNFFPT
jgi:hypothetical protein